MPVHTSPLQRQQSKVRGKAAGDRLAGTLRLLLQRFLHQAAVVSHVMRDAEGNSQASAMPACQLWSDKLRQALTQLSCAEAAAEPVPMEIAQPSAAAAAPDAGGAQPMAVDVPEGGFPSLLGPSGHPQAPARPGVYVRSAHAVEQAGLLITRLPGGTRCAAHASFGRSAVRDLNLHSPVHMAPQDTRKHLQGQESTYALLTLWSKLACSSRACQAAQGAQHMHRPVDQL